MKLNELLRLIAGTFVLLAILLGATVHPLLELLRRLCRSESDPIGLYRLVSDDGAAAKTRRPGVTQLAMGRVWD